MSNIKFDPRSGASEAALRAAQQAEDELLTQEAIADRDVAGQPPPGIHDREAIAGRDDLEIAHGQGFGGCSFSMLAKPAPAPASAEVQTETEQEIEGQAEQTVGSPKR